MRPQSVADFYREFMAALAELGVEVKIMTKPQEVPDPIPFEQDTLHASYDAEAVHRFWRILVWVDEVFKEFRAGFLGKVSPVHFFWGSFDLAVTRFSGGAHRRALAPTDHERSLLARSQQRRVLARRRRHQGPGVLLLCGAGAAGLRGATGASQAAFYHPQMKEFLLLYDDVRAADSPRDALLAFLRSTYEAAANLAQWDRKALERQP